MSIIVTDTGGGDYEKASPGIKNAVCSNSYDLGVQDTKFGPKHQVVLLWELDELDSEGVRHWVWKKYTASLNEKASLRKDIEGWAGKKLSEEQLAGLDIEKFVGKRVTINVVHNTSKDGTKTYANVGAVMAAQGENEMEPAMPITFVPSFLKEQVLDWPGKEEADKIQAELDEDIPFV